MTITSNQWALGAALVSSMLVGNGCVISDGSSLDPDPTPTDTYYTAIEADHVLDTDLGYGAGLFVEYGTGGEWQVWTSCDTKATGTTCKFEVSMTAGSPITAVQRFEFEANDSVESFGDNVLNMYSETATRSDAVHFKTQPGADLEVEILIDGIVAPQYLVWFSDGMVHDGASGSPVVFQPSTP